MSDEDRRFARWLAQRMSERALSNRQVALRSGLDHTTISRLRRGEREPSLVTALAIAKVLGVNSLLEAME